MQTLSERLSKKYYNLANDNVVVGITSESVGTCSKEGVSAVTDASKQVKIPYIHAVKTAKNYDKYFFMDRLIQVGDEYTSNTFYKCDCSEDYSGKTVEEYYKALCEEEIKNTIRRNPKMRYNDVSGDTSIFGVPDYVFTQNGYTVTPASIKINLSANFETYKKAVVEKDCKSCAESTAKSYDYNLKTLEVEKGY